MIFSEKLAEQYQALKKEEPGLVLLMQVGAFLQVMNEDARCLAEVTGLKLKMAGNPDEPFVVGGFPVSGLDLYVGKLVRAGPSVAIARQDEEKRRQVSERIRLKGA